MRNTHLQVDGVQGDDLGADQGRLDQGELRDEAGGFRLPGDVEDEHGAGAAGVPAPARMPFAFSSRSASVSAGTRRRNSS